MKQDLIEKLPPDAKKQFLKYAIKLSEKKTKSKVNDDFLSFVKHVWPEFIEGKHHKEIADKFNDLAKGKIKRLIINMPPRHTKSEFASFLLPSWMVGRKPNLKIIQTTHTTELAIRFGRKAKTLMDSQEYKQVLAGGPITSPRDLPQASQEDRRTSLQAFTRPLVEDEGARRRVLMIGRQEHCSRISNGCSML